MENTPYMESVSAIRSIAQFNEDEQGALEGSQLLSMECGEEDEEETKAYVYLCENFSSFMRYLRYLSAENQEILLSYFMLGKTQTILATINQSTQTCTSSRIRMVTRELCCYMQFGGIPSPKQIKDELTAHKLNVLVDKKARLDECIVEYRRVRDFAVVARKWDLHRPAIRRSTRAACASLLEMKDDPRASSLGAYLHNMIDKAAPSGGGLSKRQRCKLGDVYRRDPQMLGDFRWRIDSGDFKQHAFVSRANR